MLRPAPCPTIPSPEGADEKESEDQDSTFDTSRVVELLYHPLAVRTPNQRRTQITLVQILAREVQRKFNERVASLAQHKLDEIDRIESKNARIREIIGELKVWAWGCGATSLLSASLCCEFAGLPASVCRVP
jgi:hypothetical protein